MSGCYNCGDVFFDQLSVQFSKGKLKEETHYYPFGLPISALSSADGSFLENRHKYQGNEYIKELGLHWMDFHNRQYDPQIGRFMSVDPLADAGGQERFSPYAAMGNNPVGMVDPLGLSPGHLQGLENHNVLRPSNLFPTIAMHMPGGAVYESHGVGVDWGKGVEIVADNVFWDNVMHVFDMVTGNAFIQFSGAAGGGSTSKNDVAADGNNEEGPDNYTLNDDGTVDRVQTGDKSNSFYNSNGDLLMTLGASLNDAVFGKGNGQQ